MTFIEFLEKKRIDTAAFRKERPQQWEQFQKLYDQIGPTSFDLQKKFFFNDLRALFPLAISSSPTPMLSTEGRKPRPKLTLKKKPLLKTKTSPSKEEEGE